MFYVFYINYELFFYIYIDIYNLKGIDYIINTTEYYVNIT